MEMKFSPTRVQKKRVIASYLFMTSTSQNIFYFLKFKKRAFRRFSMSTRRSNKTSLGQWRTFNFLMAGEGDFSINLF